MPPLFNGPEVLPSASASQTAYFHNSKYPYLPSKVSGPDYIPVVVHQNWEPELSYIVAQLSNKCLNESCFPDCWIVSLMVAVFNNVGERSKAKNYCPVSFLSAVKKTLKNLML